MAKVDFTRDYYADLELSATADVAEIKKQFRKLALKYHPDRNPGREDQVQAKFQIIQAAHEILTNPDQKAQYDARRMRPVGGGGSSSSSHYPSASGVRGNPWADVSGRFPKPPRRPGQAPTSAARNTPQGASSSARPSTARPASAAANHQYAGFGAPPPTAKAGKEDLNSRYTAWKNMRPTPAAAASQRQKADASFGAARRPTGFYPQAPMGDEPPAASTNNYFTSRTRTTYNEQGHAPTAGFAAPTAAADDVDNNNDDDDLNSHTSAARFDFRQSTPYQTHGGERFNPLDGAAPEVAAHLNRTKSTRDAAAAAAAAKSGSQQRRRSSSLPDDGAAAGQQPGPARHSTTTQQRGTATATPTAPQQAAPQAATASSTNAPRSGSRTRPGTKARPFGAASASPMPQFEEQYRRMRVDESANAAQTDGTASPSGSKKGPIFANLSLDDDGRFRVPVTPADQAAKKNLFMSSSVEDINTRFVPDERANAAQWEFCAGGSGDHGGNNSSNDGVVGSNFSPRVRRSQSGTHLGRRSPGKGPSMRRADSFRNEAAAAAAAAAASSSSRSSSRSNNTTFAGAPPVPPVQQPPRPPSSTAGVVDGGGGSATDPKTGGSSSFDAEKWLADQISSKHFEPQPAPLRPPMPTTAAAAAAAATGGQTAPPPPKNAPTVIDLTQDDDSEADNGRDKAREHHYRQETPPPPAAAAAAGEDPPSPVAMDIDSPPTGQPAPPPFVFGRPSGTTAQDTNSSSPPSEARNIPVEPSRPEWRAGNAAAAAAAPVSAAAPPMPATAGAAPAPAPAPATVHMGGSEDSDEFRASMADLRKVEPFSEGTAGILGGAGSGLASFGDLQTHLPFESRAATAAMGSAAGSAAATGASPARRDRKRTISFPPEPAPPHAPPALAVPGLQPSRTAWDQYVAAFQQYMLAWAAFNNRYVDHFVARRNEIELRRRRQGGGGGSGGGSGGDFAWLTADTSADAASDDRDNDAAAAAAAQYLEWMAQDDEARARWAASCTRHEQYVRQFLGFRQSMKQAPAV